MTPQTVTSGLVADVHVPGRLTARLTADPGRTVAVIGPNGAGKTTLLRALAGLVDVEGSITVDGESWTDPVRQVRERRLGYVFQDQSLFPHLSALDNVAFGLRCRGLSRTESRDRAAPWLDRFGIADLAGRRPGELSGGQAQRVAIARALAPEPRLLLLDEPFAGLDVGVASALRIELAAHLAAYDGIALLVTHEALDALTLADEVLVLDAGAVAQSGTPAEVAAQPRTEHVARLVGLNVLLEDGAYRAFSPSAVTVSLDAPAGSARHRWRGRVVSAAPHGDAVRLLVRADRDLLADVTPAATAELGLAPGTEVWLSVKETAVDSYGTGHPGPLPSRP
jgi:molybdate transport system ATP-binding protein